MVNLLVFVTGALVVALTVYDFLKTAIGMPGLGPVTRRLTAML